MATGAGPYTPEKGWETRWLKQAVELCIRTPEGLLLIGAWAVLSGLSRIYLSGLLLGVYGEIVISLALSTLAVPVMISVNRLLLARDGHGSANILGVVPELSKPVMSGVFFVGSFIIALSSFLSLLMASGESAGAPPRELPPIHDVIVSIGMLPFVGAIICANVIMPLWFSVAASIGMGVTEARITSMKMLFKMPGVWACFVMIPIMIGGNIVRSPAFVSVPLLFLLISWFYVAAREIFGGIKENGKEYRFSERSRPAAA